MLVKLEIIHFDIEKIECCMQMVMMVRKWNAEAEAAEWRMGKMGKLENFSSSHSRRMCSQFRVWVVLEIFSSSGDGWTGGGKTAIRNSAKESHNRTHRKHRTNGRNDFRICVHFALHAHRATAIATVTAPRAPLAFVVQPAGKKIRENEETFFFCCEKEKNILLMRRAFVHFYIFNF